MNGFRGLNSAAVLLSSATTKAVVGNASCCNQLPELLFAKDINSDLIHSQWLSS
jgi:hypothetical protein